MAETPNNKDEAGLDPAFSVSNTPPLFEVTIWPHRSLSRKGFRNLLVLVAVGLSLPILPLLGTPVGWALVPFALAALGLLAVFVLINYRDARLTEHLRLWPEMIVVVRREPNGTIRAWKANPYWVKVALRDDGPVENYLTLTGNDREIELGAFLSPEERIALFHDIEEALHQARHS